MKTGTILKGAPANVYKHTRGVRLVIGIQEGTFLGFDAELCILVDDDGKIVRGPSMFIDDDIRRGQETEL